MPNLFERSYLQGLVQSARNQVMSKLGRLGDQVDGASIIFLEMFLWCTLFHITDTRLGTSPLNRRDERTELVLASVRKIASSLRGRKLSADELLEWSQSIAIFTARFERQVSSLGGSYALCKPFFSVCLRSLISDEFFRRMFPSTDLVAAFDVAAAHGAVFILNLGGRLNTFSVVEMRSCEIDLDRPDVFVSYSAKDRTVAAQFADSLNHLQIATWMDRELAPMDDFARTIDGRIQTARLVLVLWTANSVQSKWVQAEALYAFNTDKLVAIMLEPCSLPVPFNSVHTLAWPPDPHEAASMWEKLLDVIGPRLQRPGLARFVSAQMNASALNQWKADFPDDPLAREYAHKNE